MSTVVHKTVPIQVWADIDVGIVEMVKHLNTLEGVRTEASCQGTIGEGGAEPYGPQVLVTWSDDAARQRIAEHYHLTAEGTRWGYARPLLRLDDPRKDPVFGKIVAQRKGTGMSDHTPTPIGDIKALIGHYVLIEWPEPDGTVGGMEGILDGVDEHDEWAVLDYGYAARIGKCSVVAFDPTRGDTAPMPLNGKEQG